MRPVPGTLCHLPTRLQAFQRIVTLCIVQPPMDATLIVGDRLLAPAFPLVLIYRPGKEQPLKILQVEPQPKN